MAAISPKLDFIKFLPDVAKEARSQLPLPWFSLASQAALANFAITGATTEEMARAKKFLNILIEIGETPPEIHRLPVTKLEHLDK